MTTVSDLTLVYVVNRNFSAQPGFLYLVSAAIDNMTVQLPASASAGGQPFIIKRVNSAGHNITVQPVPGEHVNGLAAGVVLTQQGQGRWFWPGAPAGAAAGTGWTSY